MAATLTLTVKVNDAKLQNLEARIAALEKKAVINVKVNSQGLEKTNGSMEAFGQTTNYVTRSIDQLGTAIASKFKWGVIQTSLAHIGEAFRDAISNMKEVDTQLTNIMKVSGKTREELQGLSNTAYSMASQYGIQAGEYMSSVYEYTKAGFGDAAEQMAELSTKAMLVGDTTSQIADKFLIAGNAAFGFGGNIQDLSLLIDQADFINNRYATTLDKIAEGFPRVASVANMANMSAQETMAALGTITATTQETAQRASTALRALILNILKDTTTEVEDGVTVTTEQVNSLQSALQKYAPQVVKAANATGQLIDPMEALAALAESYKQGDLTQAGLFEIENALGGKLRTNQLDALLKNFDMYKEMLEGMGGAAGTADKEIETMLTSWESKLNILENTWTEFVSKTLNSDVFKGLIEGATGLLNLFGNLGSAATTFGGVLAAIHYKKLASGATASLDSLRQAMNATSNSVADLTAKQASLAQQMEISRARNRTDTQAYVKLSDAYQKTGAQLKTQQGNLKDLEQQYKDTADSANRFNKIAAGISIATAAFTAVTMIANKLEQDRKAYYESVHESAQRSQELADSAHEESENIYELYAAYQAAKDALDTGTGSQDEFKEAAYRVAEALGIETDAVYDLGEAIDITSQKELEAELKKIRRGIHDTESDIVTTVDEMQDEFDGLFGEGNILQSGPKQQFLQFANGIDSLPFKQQLEEILGYYEQTQNTIESLNLALDDPYGAGKATYGRYAHSDDPVGEIQKELTEWENIEATLEESIGNYQELLGQQSDVEGWLQDLHDGTVDTSKALSEQSDAYEEVAGSVDEATNAIDRYTAAVGKAKDSDKDNTSKVKGSGDDWKTVASGWGSAYEDIQKGLVNSDNVKAVAKMLFSEESLWEARKQGKSYAEMLMSGVLTDAFTYLDENGVAQLANGEDFGALLTDALMNADTEDLFNGYEAELTEAGDKIIKKNGEVAASFSIDKETGKLSYVVKDVDALSEALGGLNPEILEVWAKATGNYSEGIQTSAEELTEMAKQFGALDTYISSNGGINFQKFVKGAHEAGYSLSEIADYVDAIQKSEDLTFGINFDGENAEEQIETIVNEAEKEKELKVDTSDFDNKVKNSIDLLHERDKLWSVQTPEDQQAEENAKKIEENKKRIEEYEKLNPVHTTFITNAPDAARDVNALEQAVQHVDSNKTITFHIKQEGEIPNTSTATKTKVKDREASGTSNAPGGLTLVNERGPEIIAENGIARIAGGGDPVLTVLQRGATVFNAEDTRKIFERSGIRALGGGFRGDNIPSGWKPASTDSSSGKHSSGNSSGGSSGGNGGGGGTSSDKDPQLEALKAGVERAKSWLKYSEAIYEATGDTNENYARQAVLTKSIAAALLEQIQYLETHNGDQTEINNLYAEYYGYVKQTAELERKDALEAAEKKTSLLKSQLEVLEAQNKPVDEQIAKQREIYSALGEQMTLLSRQKQDMIDSGRDASEIEEQINEIIKERAEIREDIREKQREEAEEDVSLQKSRLSLMEAQGKPLKERLKQQKEIYKALGQQMTVLWRQGASEEEINAVIEERAKLRDEMKEERAQALADETSKLKSQLTLLEARDTSERSQIKKEREIAKSLEKQLELAKKQGKSQEELNALRTEYYNTTKNIQEREQKMYDNLETAVNNKISKLNEKRDEELKKLQDSRDALKEENELEEKRLALEEAREKLHNVKAERNVRIFNAKTGKWEWVANGKDVEAAREDYQKAKESLQEYKDEQKYQAQQERINKKYDDRIAKWQKVLDALEEPEMTVGRAVSSIEQNGTKDMKSTIQELNKLLKPLGYSISTKKLYDKGGVLQGLGGIKATSADEMILPPDLTKAMLSPVATQSFGQRMNELRYMYGATTGLRNGSSSVGEMFNGDVYKFGDITLSEQQARGTSVYELAQMARNLRSYTAR